MKEHSLSITSCEKKYRSGANGLSQAEVNRSKEINGSNVLSEKKQKSLFKKIMSALSDPMLVILEFALIITLGINLGKYFKNKEADFIECLGIGFSILISVSLTVFMEGRSQKAFKLLNRLYEKTTVKVIRNGKNEIISREEVVVGDRVILVTGDKICADGRLVKSKELSVDESALTGESDSVRKDANAVLPERTLLAERTNCVYSGTLVVTGNGEMIVTSVGDKTQMGEIASELQIKNCVSAPLNDKLTKLSRSITVMGIVCAFFVFVLSVIKLAINKELVFSNVSDCFVNAIVLIVASVPEGLPATVAVSLTLNVVKLSKSNALIKKMVATETVGCVSVICSDKTGTLTQNKMTCEKIICKQENKSFIAENVKFNSTVKEMVKDGKTVLEGSPTEKALVTYFKDFDFKGELINSTPFSSDTKYTSATVKKENLIITYFKGAPEKIIEMCALNDYEKSKILDEIAVNQKKGKRCIAFAHKKETTFFDGYACISDPVRKDVKKAVNECIGAGIKVKILTGDNYLTACAVAEELGLNTYNGVLNAEQVEEMSDEKLKSELDKVNVIARSTPMIKLRIVRLLKEMGEVVAVTGDGINDAPAMKQADIGIAMGSGEEITKEAGDVILLDDSFSTIVKAIAFGRSVYKNFQRFIMFQLTVNISAVSVILICSLLGLDSPFTSMQLLWLNVIMDGPPALSLSLEGVREEYMQYPPVKRSAGIINKRILAKVIINAGIIGFVVLYQYSTNFLNVNVTVLKAVTFTLFAFMNIFNAFNCKELGTESVIKNFFSNKLMVASMGVAMALQFVITEFTGVFSPEKLGFKTWGKIIGISLTLILINELYKTAYRIIKKNIQNLHKKRYYEKTGERAN